MCPLHLEMEQENRRRKGRSTFLLFSSPTVQRRNSMTEMKQFIIVHNIIYDITHWPAFIYTRICTLACRLPLLLLGSAAVYTKKRAHTERPSVIIFARHANRTPHTGYACFGFGFDRGEDSYPCTFFCAAVATERPSTHRSSAFVHHRAI